MKAMSKLLENNSAEEINKLVEEINGLRDNNKALTFSLGLAKDKLKKKLGALQRIITKKDSRILIDCLNEAYKNNGTSSDLLRFRSLHEWLSAHQMMTLIDEDFVEFDNPDFFIPYMYLVIFFPRKTFSRSS